METLINNEKEPPMLSRVMGLINEGKIRTVKELEHAVGIWKDEPLKVWTFESTLLSEYTKGYVTLIGFDLEATRQRYIEVKKTQNTDSVSMERIVKEIYEEPCSTDEFTNFWYIEERGSM